MYEKKYITFLDGYAWIDRECSAKRYDKLSEF